MPSVVLDMFELEPGVTNASLGKINPSMRYESPRYLRFRFCQVVYLARVLFHAVEFPCVSCATKRGIPPRYFSEYVGIWSNTVVFRMRGLTTGKVPAACSEDILSLPSPHSERPQSLQENGEKAYDKHSHSTISIAYRAVSDQEKCRHRVVCIF